MRRRFAVFALLLLFLSAARFARAASDLFDWRQCEGQTLLVLFNQHPYAEAIIRRIADFEDQTGVNVAYRMVPEERYFPQLAESVDAKAGKPDVFMTGPYQVWEYAPAGWIRELDPFLANPRKTRSNYTYRDFFPGIAGAFRWNGIAGHPTGDGSLWALPIGFEANCLTCNSEVLVNNRLRPPTTMMELIEIGRRLREFEGEGTFGIAVRGLADWNTLHSGYMTAFANYGAKDMEIENGRLVSRVNSPEAVAITDLWLRMLAEGGPRDWRYYDWYGCGTALGERRAAIMFDADIVGFFQNVPGASPQAGKLASAPPPTPLGAEDVKSNLWVWGLAMNANSNHPDAAWLFIQYFTSREFQLWSVIEGKSINPPRRSVFESLAFQNRISGMTGFADTFSRVIDGTAIQYTPNPHFFEISRKWAQTLHDIADGVYPNTQAGMDALKHWMDERLRDVPVE
ncbi:MAG: extracellular solute-binding protein [Planctomycetota bacterium]|jgi:multiple sugar transport system substrate-binding protein|nr:extracellular solute-binding protein [Planctomycetota bacterium]